ncbi:Imidazole glycerol phosphate synthase amidotransferase subunit [Fulvivirga imtechensis AK7]|uniref:Imidazole glycerol phosphate synthase subunit HisH n=1 Tax=Fulvivirga imtechensis AK7 TaxID=1237149 RepID=L8JRR8_9BACT|nr:imidazole glycerol phosphate synthase subunit HisH [Fulvivirga imtechensis]ELR70888.1 Imidazole glycerol phosphate synthase amidotransferase subunit [Fulvivirga imtechensis AK7]
MKTVIIKYNAGNTQSVIYALERLGITPVLTSNFEEIQSADKVIFPGVGEASSTMRHLQELGLDRLIPTLQQPVLGICLGMQLMCDHSEENDTQCMGVFNISVKKFRSKKGEKVPHMGWNNLTPKNSGWISQNVVDRHMYFVHSYYVPVIEETVATCDYILPFSAALQKNNFYATQFHPEKSGKQGEQIIKNFIEL